MLVLGVHPADDRVEGHAVLHGPQHHLKGREANLREEHVEARPLLEPPAVLVRPGRVHQQAGQLQHNGVLGLVVGRFKGVRQQLVAERLLDGLLRREDLVLEPGQVLGGEGQAGEFVLDGIALLILVGQGEEDGVGQQAAAHQHETKGIPVFLPVGHRLFCLFAPATASVVRSLLLLARRLFGCNFRRQYLVGKTQFWLFRRHVRKLSGNNKTTKM